MRTYEYLLKCEFNREHQTYILYLPNHREHCILSVFCKKKADAFFPTLKNSGEHVSLSLKQLGPAAKWLDYEWQSVEMQNQQNVLGVYMQMQAKRQSGLKLYLYRPTTHITGRRYLNTVWVSTSFLKCLPPWLAKLKLDEVIEAEVRLRRAGSQRGAKS